MGAASGGSPGDFPATFLRFQAAVCVRARAVFGPTAVCARAPAVLATPACQPGASASKPRTDRQMLHQCSHALLQLFPEARAMLGVVHNSAHLVVASMVFE